MTSRQSFDVLGRRLNGKELPSEDNSDDDSINESDSNTNLTPSLLTLQNQQSLAPPKLTISTLQSNVPQSEIQHHRHLLRTRSSNGATAHASGGTSGKRDEHEAGENGGNGSGSRRIAVGNEFMLAELPSPILTTPNQGLSGLSEKLTHLQSRASSQASSRKNSSSGPINGEHQDAENSTSFSTNDILHSPAAAVALIAQASKTGSRFGGEVKDNRSSITQPPSRRQSSSIESVQMEKSLSTGDPTLNAIASKNNQVNRRNDPISSVGPSTASASHTGTPNVSGTSTPAMKNHSMRLKPNVLETSHLHLQTHTPSGRRMINQYVIEDELGRGVHGKVRLARDTETGERVAVKIVEREGKKKLGQNSNIWNKRISINSTNTKGKEIEGNISSETDPVKIPQEGSVDSSNQRQPIARFAASPPHSPGNTLSRYQAAQIAARYGRWGEGAPNRPTYGDLEMEKQREKERKRLLWTTDQKVKREIAIMKKCSHDNVVRLKEVIDDPHSKKVFMILEYMEGGEVVWKDERGFPTLTVDEARRTFRDVVLGLEYLHYQGIIHRDIKPANLLLDKNYKVKISDFGVSHFSYALLVSSGGLPSFDNDEERQKDPSLADDRELAKTAGSPAFFAPELCLAGEPILTTSSSKAGVESDGEQPIQKPSSRPPITKAIDIWALGVTLYCLLFGHVPFTADNEFALFSVITKEDFELPAYMGADRIRIGPRAKRWVNIKPWTDEEGDVDEDHMRGPKEPDVDVNSLNDEALMVRDLLGKLLEKDPMKRIKLEDVKKHPWLTQGLADPPQWLSETDPSHIPLVQVTREDVETALTGFSKIKQTLKKLQHKFFSGFTGHGYDREIEIQKALPGNMEHKERVQRRRSKSASQASNDVPSFVTNSSKTSPKNAISNAKMLPPGSHSPQMVQNETFKPNSASSRPHFFFSRRKSVALDGNKQGLTVKKRHSQLRPGNSVSQPGSRSHSPNQLEMEEEEGFIKIETEGRSSRISPQRRSSRRYDETVLPMSSLEPIISGQGAGAGAGNTLHSTLAGQEQALRTRKSGNDKMRPASRGSLRVLESYNVFHNQSNKLGTDSSSIASHDRDLSGLQNRTFSGSTTSSSIGGPSRPRSRSRLGDVFRNVWTHGNNEGNSMKQSRFRSRPVTSASSAAVSPVLDKGVKMLQDQQRTASENNVLQRNQTNHQNNDKTPTMKSISKMTPTKSIEQLDSISQAHHNNPPKIIGVDDIDTDLDLSDEDSDENHQISGGDEEHVWRGTSAGWSIGKINPQNGITNSDSVEDTKENRERDSFTPSVEGGYNVFKPPFQGKFVLDTSSGDKRNDSVESNSYSEDQQQKFKRQNKQQIVNKSSHVPGPDVSPGDLTIMSEDRFADAEEATYDHHEQQQQQQQQQQQDQQQTNHLVQPVSTSNHIVQNIVSPTAAFMQRGGSTISSSQASDSISGADEDEGGVSFQTKRRLGR